MSNDNRTATTTAADLGRFPGRTITGVAMMTAPVLLIIGASLFIGIYDRRGAEQLAVMVEHRARAMAAVNFAIAGVVIAALAVAGLAAVVARTRPRLGRVGGALTLVGLFGPGFFLGINFLTIGLAKLGDRAALVAALEDAEMTPSIVNLTGPALIAGLIVLAVGAAKSGVLSKPRSWALGLAALAPVGFISGIIAISVVAWTCLAIALVPLGFGYLRAGQTPRIDTALGG